MHVFAISRMAGDSAAASQDLIIGMGGNNQYRHWDSLTSLGAYRR